MGDIFVFDLVKNDKTTYAALAEGPEHLFNLSFILRKNFIQLKKIEYLE